LRDEIIIDNSSTSAFTYTDLDMILRNKGITDVVLAGLVTNVMMESTARDAVNRGYFCHFLKDCSMSFTDELHNWTVANVLPMFGNVIDSRTYIDAVGEAK